MARSAPAMMLPLELGQEIEAQVVEMRPHGSVMVDIGGTLLKVNDSGSLSRGISPDVQLLNVKV